MAAALCRYHSHTPGETHLIGQQQLSMHQSSVAVGTEVHEKKTQSCINSIMVFSASDGKKQVNLKESSIHLEISLHFVKHIFHKLLIKHD